MPKRVSWSPTATSVNRLILEEAIKQFGYGVDMAKSGDETLAALHNDAAGDICLVLLDLVMPGHRRHGRA
jgi:CheY-like chemotaxis protein